MGGLNEGLVAEADAMLRDGYIEGLARNIRRAFPSLGEEATAAIGHAVERLILRPVAPREPRRYLATSAYNEMRGLARRRGRYDSLDALSDSDGNVSELQDQAWTVEEQALLDATYRELRAVVESWETDHVRVVTLLYLEAAYEGEPLSSEDAADLVADVLGEDVDADFVRTWKSRGFRKLREWVTAARASEDQLEEVP